MSSEPGKETWLRVREAAHRMSVSCDLVYRLCADGRLAHRRIGRYSGRGRIAISSAACDRFLESCDVRSSGSVSEKKEATRKATGLRPDGKPVRSDWLD